MTSPPRSQANLFSLCSCESDLIKFPCGILSPLRAAPFAPCLPGLHCSGSRLLFLGYTLSIFLGSAPPTPSHANMQGQLRATFSYWFMISLTFISSPYPSWICDMSFPDTRYQAERMLPTYTLALGRLGASHRGPSLAWFRVGWENTV